MQRALELATLGIGHVSPNPLVGCVVVHHDTIVGEGWHKKYGQPHAEVNAIDSVNDKSLLKEATLYVNLEPCSHQGKTPPCADLILRHQIPKVVIANLDTHPLVAGEGIRKLREHGVDVVTGIQQKDGRYLNRRFFTYVEKQRPYIILKWAETSDGFLAHENFESKWISNEYSRQLVHRWRSEEDAVLIGPRTARHDDPMLNVREWSGRNPLRVVFDRFLRLSDSLKVFDRSQPTVCYNLLRHEEHQNLTLVRLGEANFWDEMFQDLYRRKVQSVMIEGGAQTLEHFIISGYWDEARVFRSQRMFQKGIAAPTLKAHLVSQAPVLDDQLSIFVNEKILLN